MNKEILFKNRESWLKWLEKYHDRYNEIWLIYYKKHINKDSIKQPEAVEEALCYGWIDSIVKRIDDEKYKQKFTPRNNNSVWSEINKNRVAKLIRNGKMTEFGMNKVNAAKRNGKWTQIQQYTNINKIPKELKELFEEDDLLKKKFKKLASSHKRRYLYWINEAKREDTKKRRITKVIKSLEKGEILGMV